jgi:hypothetical protein
MLSNVKLVRLLRVVGLLTVLTVLVGTVVQADGPVSPAKDSPANAAIETSHRLIGTRQSPVNR